MHIKFGFDWQSSEEKFECYYNIHVFCLEVGADEPQGSIFFKIINILSYFSFPVSFFLNDI